MTETEFVPPPQQKSGERKTKAWCHRWNTYWPHIDNVWSHRSTQASKNNIAGSNNNIGGGHPVKTHYYDCRLKGRPSGGTASSLSNGGGGGDANRKKRKRASRERDLCDMKIKVTETTIATGRVAPDTGQPILETVFTIERVRREVLHRATPGGGYVVERLDREKLIAEHQKVLLLSSLSSSPSSSSSSPSSRPSSGGEIQRQQQLEDGVNGLSMVVRPDPSFSAAGGGGGGGGGLVGGASQGAALPVDLLSLDSYGVPGFLGEVHRHTLAQSDGIKKCTVQRELLKRSKKSIRHGKETKLQQVGFDLDVIDSLEKPGWSQIAARFASKLLKGGAIYVDY